MRRPRRALVLAALAVGGLASAARAGKPPKPLEPIASIKPEDQEGYFDEVFGIDDDGRRLAVIRSDGATFAKLETYDLGVIPPKQTAAADLPIRGLTAVRLEVGAFGEGIVLVARETPDDVAPVYALRFADAGKLTAKAGPATAFVRPPAAGTPRAKLLIAFEAKPTGHGSESSYAVTPYALRTLAPAGPTHTFRADPTGTLKAPPLRLVGFFDGYTRILGERAGAYDKAADVRGPSRMVVVDTLSGKPVAESAIADVVGWAITNQLRRDHPGQATFVDLNQDGSGVDVVDAMGKRHPAALAVPFRLYDPKTLVVEEGPAPQQLQFGIAVDPLNVDAVKRQKPDPPMLDVYTSDAETGDVRLRGRVFIPRPVTWRMRADRLVVLKRFKNFARGGDELQVFTLR
jgi:hypothetical protein